MQVPDNTTSVSNPNVNINVTWSYGTMQPIGFPVLFDISGGDIYNSCIPYNTFVGSITNNFLQSALPTYNTFAESTPLLITVNSSSSYISYITVEKQVQLISATLYAVQLSSGQYVYQLNVTLQVYIIPGYPDAYVFNVSEQKDSLSFPTAIFTYQNGTLSTLTLDVCTGMNSTIQTLIFTTPSTFVQPQFMLGQYTFAAAGGQTTTSNSGYLNG